MMMFCLMGRVLVDKELCEMIVQGGGCDGDCDSCQGGK
jgi:hypothetical protein